MLSSVDLRKLRIVHYPDPVLREQCKPVTEFGATLQDLVTCMFEIMGEGRGVGLAAPQVGLPIRLFVCNTTGDPEGNRAYVNPELAELEGLVEAEEGCLSLPEVTVPMRRAQSATLTACDLAGNKICVSRIDLEARAWQHECDHLNGRLIIDNMPTSAELVNRRILKELKEKYQARKKRR
ncbi:MAG: peptide deformylase [Phycisphaerae bacterium]|nr:peptide deformylase [Phycisphaerae bacterium]